MKLVYDAAKFHSEYLNMPRAQTIAAELVLEIEELVSTGRLFEKHDASIIALEQKVKQLAKADLRDGYVALAAISMLRGDYDEMRSRYSIAQNQGLSAAQKLNHITTLVHSGFFSEATDILKSVADALPNPMVGLVKAVLCFQFQIANKLAARAKQMSQPPVFDQIVSKYSEVNRVTERHQLDGDTLARLADYAGEVLREFEVYYSNVPEMIICPSEEVDDELEEFVVATFDVPVSCEVATDMTFALAEKLISAGQPSEYFFFRFRGME